MVKTIKASLIFTGMEVINNGAIIIEDNQIVDVGSIDDVHIPDGSEIIEFPNQTVMPGLIDSHTHLTLSAQISNYAAAMRDSNSVLLIRGSQNMQMDLASGVTTMRILGEKDFIDVDLKEITEKNIIPGPRLLISGKGIRSSFGHGLMGPPFDGVDEVRKAARINIHDAGADQIKIFVTGSKGEFRNFKFSTEATVERNEMHCLFTLEEIKAVVDTAHSVGKKVAAHCYGGRGLQYCVEAGVDSIEHGIYIDDDDLEAMLNSGTWLTLTSNAYLNDQRFINRGTPELTDGFYKHREYIRSAYTKVIKSGLNYSVGTDGQHGEIAFELETVVDLGADPIEALKAATIKAAQSCGVDDKVGTLEKGKLADIIAVKGNPTRNISDIRNIDAVFKDGIKVIG